MSSFLGTAIVGAVLLFIVIRIIISLKKKKGAVCSDCASCGACAACAKCSVAAKTAAKFAAKSDAGRSSCEGCSQYAAGLTDGSCPACSSLSSCATSPSSAQPSEYCPNCGSRTSEPSAR